MVKAIAIVSLIFSYSFVHGQAIDSLNYNEKDFVKMKVYYQNDSSFNRTIDRRISNGDSSSVVLQKILNSEYGKWPDYISKREIDIMIHSFYVSKKILDKFYHIQNTIDNSTSATDIRTKSQELILKLDSMKNLMDSVVIKN